MNNQTENTETLELTQLKSHREKLQLSVQTVADSMKVSRDLISRIESGEFDKLGASTFVRGHFTNYCKVLGIEPNSILAQIPAQYLTHQELQTSSAMGGSPLSHVRRQSNHLGRYAIGTGLLGMLCMSFYFVWDKWSQPNVPLTDDYIISQGEEVVDGKKKITYSSLIPQVTGPNLTSDQPGTNTSYDEPVVQAPTLISEDDISGATGSEEAETETPQDDMEGEQDSNQLLTNNNQFVEDGISIDGTDTEPSRFSIVMKFEEQAWVSIKTLDGELVVQDLLGPGLKEIQVNEPVHFRIGNATKMQLSINDDSIELAPLTRQDVADFEWPLEPSS